VDEDLIARAQRYARRHKAVLRDRLGFGIHGIVYAAQRNRKPGRSALKFHSRDETYYRERQVYRRLKEQHVVQIHGLHVPQLLDFDDEFLMIGMTIVSPPYLLDFAGAYLDEPPVFPDHVLGEWEADKREQFGPHWEDVRLVLSTLENYGIFLVDVSPSNITFRDPVS